ncbi:MAG: zinc ABC transporter substrate-binding protein [Deltaproteobacteria bacterium]|nr:zinc ABC transporter substrate-binding protein [Deltaproteobacteria bacterium]
MKKSTRWRWCLCLTLMAMGCSKASESNIGEMKKNISREAPISAVATVGMIANAVKEVGGELVKVTGLMGPGVDPHLYKASEGDIQRLSEADVIFYNGLNLEGKMGDIFVKMARARPVVAVTDNIDPKLLREPPEFQGHFDPHVWFDVKLWSQTVPIIADALTKIDPAHAGVYKSNADRYVQELLELDHWCRSEIAKIPPSERVLVTAHDAFGYFGKAYQIEVLGLQGISTVSEFGLKDVQRLVDLIVSRNVKAVFVESSIPKRSIEAVVEGARSRGHQVAIGGTLYSDAMGMAGTPEGTYVGMVKANVSTIVAALLGKTS